jgi:hypothetical protein
MSNLVIEPAEGMIALEFLDDEKQEETRPQYDAPSSSDDYNEAVFAICVGVGKKVTNCKRGDTVVVRAYARHGVKVDDDVVIVESYCVVGTVKTS